MSIADLRQIVTQKHIYVREHLEQLYNSYLQEVFAVYGVFKNYFGEDFVDLQLNDGFDTLLYFLLGNKLDCVFSNRIQYRTGGEQFTYLSDIRKKFPRRDILDLSFHYLRKFKTNPIDTMSKLKIVGRDSLVNTLTDQRFQIIVHFPKVRVINEHDRFIDIEDLWAKISLVIGGKLIGIFKLNRSTYSEFQFRNDYMHSHIQHIPVNAGDSFTTFQEPCLGNGPIRATMSTLCVKPTINIWKLFCVELNSYVRIESLAGGPWRRLESLGEERLEKDIPTFGVPIYPFISRYFRSMNSSFSKTVLLWQDFIRYFIQKRALKFKYVDHYYTLAMSYVEYMVTISDVFIEWYNLILNSESDNKPYEDPSRLLNIDVLSKGILKDGHIFRKRGKSSTHIDFENYIGNKVLDFKGKPVTLNIYSEDTEEDNESYFLSREIALPILQQILNIINFRYGTKNHKQKEEDEFRSAFISRNRHATSKSSRGSSKKGVWYI